MRFFIFPLLLVSAVSARPSPASISWSSWRISSSEELWNGVKYPQEWDAPRYPLTRLFDRDVQSAWVYNATSREFDSSLWKSRYGLELEPNKPVTVDEIRVVNGQNVSSTRFKANHRAKTVKITVSDGKRQRSYVRPLADKQGWQTLRFPRSTAKKIILEFPQLVHSSNPKADFCLSEIELRDRGHKIDLKMPQLVVYYNGSPGDSEPEILVRRDGIPLDSTPIDIGYFASWSPSGRFVSGAHGEKGAYGFMMLLQERRFRANNFLPCALAT